MWQDASKSLDTAQVVPVLAFPFIALFLKQKKLKMPLYHFVYLSRNRTLELHSAEFSCNDSVSTVKHSACTQAYVHFIIV